MVFRFFIWWPGSINTHILAQTRKPSLLLNAEIISHNICNQFVLPFCCDKIIFNSSVDSRDFHSHAKELLHSTNEINPDRYGNH